MLSFARLQLTERPTPRLPGRHDNALLATQGAPELRSSAFWRDPRRAEENNRVAKRSAHFVDLAAGVSTWPPNSNRIADRSLSA